MADIQVSMMTRVETVYLYPACVVLYQVDNHLPGVIFPVLVSKRQEETPVTGDKGQAEGIGSSGGGARVPLEETPFLELSIIKEVNQTTNTAHYDYVAFRWVRCGSVGLPAFLVAPYGFLLTRMRTRLRFLLCLRARKYSSLSQHSGVNDRSMGHAPPLLSSTCCGETL